VERHGAHEAARMLDRYRGLVRQAVAEFSGAEIRTEGDSFYVVFDGASAAIECGLAITNAAGAAARDDPTTVFEVGIGIHAGETVETAEGYVGTAVNTAARICAQAGPNQVLVSGTVRALTAGVVDAAFAPVGRRRLKGLAEAIELYRVIGTGTSAPVARRGRALAIGAAAILGAAGVVVAAVLWAVDQEGDSATESSPVSPSAIGAILDSQPPSESGAPSAEGPQQIIVPARTDFGPLPQPVPVPPGSYAFPHFRPSVTFEVSAPGWQATTDDTDTFELIWVDPDRSLEHYMHAAHIQVAFNGPCSDSETRLLDRSAHAVIEWLQSHPYIQAAPPVPVSVNGYPGLSMDIQQAKAPEGCPSFADRVYLFRLDQVSWWLGPDERVRVIVLDIGETPLTFMIGSSDPSSFEAVQAAADDILASIQITP